jgi:tRNA-Thr(GGU) m(6)t(6)A37 methyltransferase TsaA
MMKSESMKGRPYVLRPVGYVESSLVDIAEAPSQGDEGAPEAWLNFDPEIYDAVRDLEVGDRIIVITWLHLSRRDVLRTYPRDLADAPHLGVFSLRAPDRPNPIGLHTVEILEVSGLRIRVNNLEAVNGTPILDVKPVV